MRLAVLKRLARVLICDCERSEAIFSATFMFGGHQGIILTVQSKTKNFTQYPFLHRK
jgi:hypothetical protein